MTDPKGPSISESLGRAIHGDRWDDVKTETAARVAAVEATNRREARIKRLYSIAVNVFAILVAVFVLAILAALSLAAWRWVL